jgi:probable blue pigment (indigoidine) exporter
MLKNVLIGILFAMLWASAAVATKFGIRTTDPLILANVRFLIGGSAMLGYVHILRREKLPERHIWRPLFCFAFLNTTVYLGAFVLSMKTVSAGIGSLATAIGTLFVVIIAAFCLKRKLRWFEILGVFVGLIGSITAIWPTFQNSHASFSGLLILLLGVISISVASVFYTRIDWQLPALVFNGWQVMIGGILLLPFTLIFADFKNSQFDITFWLGVGWLIVPVSVIGLQFWFYLLKQDAVRASLWMLLCPVFGFIYASILLQEPLTWHTFVGTAFVIAGLTVAQLEKFNKPKP